MKKIFVTLLFVLGCLSMSAQTFDEYKRQAQERFTAYKSQKEKEFADYRAKANAEFAEFMRQAWKRFDGQPAVPKPSEEPDVPPVVLPELEEPQLPDNEVPYADIVPIDFDEMDPVPLLPLPEEPEPAPLPEEPSVRMTFYGSECVLRFNQADKVYMMDASENSAADMWLGMSEDPKYDALIVDCLRIRSEMSLCDWAYYLLAGKVAESVYGKGNEAVMLTAFIMNQSGYSLKLGRTDDGRLHILIGTEDGIYGYPCYVVNDRSYYLTDGTKVQSLYVFDRDFPNEKALRMSISGRQKFATDMAESRRLVSKKYPSADVCVRVNRNLMDFYGDYPCPYRKSGVPAAWAFYATAPLCECIQMDLLTPLAASIHGKTQEEAANILINFVQTAFDYQTDEEQWGYERPLFAEETLFYPYSDCEDRSILFATLVRELLGLDVVFLHFSGHLATAVAFDEHISGDYIDVDGRRYLVCDPTYINAPIGMAMPDLELESVIRL